MSFENRVVICCLFYLLGMLSVDLVIDSVNDGSLKRAYYCALLDSFSTAWGLLRIAPASILLAVFSLIGFLKSRGLARKLNALTIAILVLCGLPLFVSTARLVHRSCQGELFPSLKVVRYHYGILAVLASTVVLQIIVSHTKTKQE